MIGEGDAEEYSHSDGEGISLSSLMPRIAAEAFVWEAGLARKNDDE